MNWLKKLQECFECDSVFYTKHAKFEMENEELGRIHDYEVYEAVCNGEVIEEYSEDKPYPSCLMFGMTKSKRPLHVVCAYNNEEQLVIIITVYHPNPDLWIANKTRRKS